LISEYLAKNNSEFIYYGKLREMGSPAGSAKAETQDISKNTDKCKKLADKKPKQPVREVEIKGKNNRKQNAQI
jgi:hypothetical protein